MPPPELHFGKWRESIVRLRSLKFARIAPTHFGIYEDADWQLSELQKKLDAAEAWLSKTMPAEPPIEQLREQFAAWMEEQAIAEGLTADVIKAYTLANPPGMSADGLMRYWKKVKLAER
jgi:hypothetical protein